MSNNQWVHPQDPEARVLKLKDERIHLGFKDEQAVDLDAGAVVEGVVHLGDTGDTQSFPKTLQQAQQRLVSLREGAAAQDTSSPVEEV